MTERNLEQEINIKFCVKTGKSANEMLTLLKMAYDKHAMKKLCVFVWDRGVERRVRRCTQQGKKVGSEKHKEQRQIWTECESWCTQLEN